MLKLSHNDTAQSDDAFNQADFIKKVSEIIKDCEPPKGIAINGYWGTGKTSSLMQIRKELATDANIVPIWFEAWRYQSETMPIVALLQEIRLQLSTWQKFVKKGEKLTEITMLGILAAVDTIIKVASGGMMTPASNLNKIPEIGKQWEDNYLETPLSNHHVSNLLEKAIEALSKKGDKRLVIFIDDLDRCLPNVALQLLEGIKFI